MSSREGRITRRRGTRPSVRRGHRRGGPLQAGRGTVVVLGPRRVSALDVDARGEAVRLEVLDTAEVDPKAAQTAGVAAAFARVLPALPRNRKVRALLLPPLVQERLLHLPEVPRRRLGRLVAHHESEGTAMATAFRVLGPSWEGRSRGLGVTAASASAELVQRILDMARHAGVRLRELNTRPVSGPALLELFGDAGVPERCMLVEVHDGRVRFSLMAGCTVTFSRAVDLVPDEDPHTTAGRVVTELQRTSTFLAGRLRQEPAEELVVVGDGRRELEPVRARLQELWDRPVHGVVARLRLVGDAPPELAPCLADVTGLLACRDLAAAGSLGLRAGRSLRRRARPLAAAGGLAAGALCLLLLLDAGGQAAARAAALRATRGVLQRRLADLPDHTGDLERARARSRALARRVETFATFAARGPSVRRVLTDLLGRMPPAAVVDSIRVGWEPVYFQDVEDEEAARLRMTAELQGRTPLALKPADRLAKQTFTRLTASPWVVSGENTSGRFDPFALQADRQLPLYPLGYWLVLREETP